MDIAGRADNKAQYANSSKLAARGRLHQKYTEAEMGWFEWVAETAALAEGARVLDVGCGPGWFWAASKDHLPATLDITLSDLSAGMIGEAMPRVEALGLGPVRGVEADASALPFEDQSFDAVIAMHMLYHLPDPAVGIAEMARVLKPGGKLLVTTNGMGNLKQLYGFGAAVFGGPSEDPGAIAFDIEKGRRLLAKQLGNVEVKVQPARLRVTDAQDVFDTLTSYPPGDGADESHLTMLREIIDAAFAKSDGVLVMEKEVAALTARKAD